MKDTEIDRLAKALFEKENTSKNVTWDAISQARAVGLDTIVGVGEETRERYRRRVRNGERSQ